VLDGGGIERDGGVPAGAESLEPRVDEHRDVADGAGRAIRNPRRDYHPGRAPAGTLAGRPFEEPVLRHQNRPRGMRVLRPTSTTRVTEDHRVVSGKQRGRSMCPSTTTDIGHVDWVNRDAGERAIGHSFASYPGAFLPPGTLGTVPGSGITRRCTCGWNLSRRGELSLPAEY
jgi:hypothetical protein